jgi:hypothetical protein
MLSNQAIFLSFLRICPQCLHTSQILRFSDRFAICHCFCCGISRCLSNYTLAAKILTSSVSHWSERTGVFGFAIAPDPTRSGPPTSPPCLRLTSTPPTPDFNHIRPQIHTAFSSWPLQSSYVAACTFFFNPLVYSTRDTLDWYDQPASRLFNFSTIALPSSAYPPV